MELRGVESIEEMVDVGLVDAGLVVPGLVE
jgi:hypothetical protein